VAIKDISPCHGTCSWGFYIGEDMRDSGIGVLMEIHGIDHMVTTHNIRKIFGDALKSSERVLHLHKQFGFVEEAVFKEQVYKDGGYEDVVRIALFTEKWPHIRKRVMDQFVLVE
jgi:RimJ/RimL family protein N-acetyltransferase